MIVVPTILTDKDVLELADMASAIEPESFPVMTFDCRSM
jgi:hypothetical protein